MKRYFLLSIIVILCLFLKVSSIAQETKTIGQKTFALNNNINCLEQFGFDITFDKVNKHKNRVFLINIYTDSAAQKAGFKIGDELIKINNKKIKNMTLEELHNELVNSNSADFIIKSDRKIKNVNLIKTNICTNVCLDIDNNYKNDWELMYGNSQNIDYIQKWLIYNYRISNKLSKQTKKHLQYVKWNNNYWKIKQEQFKKGYNICISNYKNEMAQRNCIFSMINNTVNTNNNKRHIKNKLQSF